MASPISRTAGAVTLAAAISLVCSAAPALTASPSASSPPASPRPAASVSPTSAPPASIAPASVAPASVAPASVAPASVAPASVAPADSPAPNLVTGTAPAFAMVLPDGWQVSDGPAPLQATSATGDTLVLAVEDVPTEATFNDYVKRVEAGLEKTAKTDLPTSYRQAGSGLIARIGTTLPDATPGTEPTTLFLFPTCTDGARTLTLTGTAEPAAEIGGLDSWDAMAAAFNPCEAASPPTLAVDPVIHALIAPYLGYATDFATRTNAAFQPLIAGARVPVWNKQMTTLASIEQEYIDGVSGLPWTPELQVLVDPLMDEHRDSLAIEKKLSKAKTVKAIKSLDAALGKAAVPTRASAAALRLAMGLSTAPQ